MQADLDVLPLLTQALQGGPGGVALAVAAGILLLVQGAKRMGAVVPILADRRVVLGLALLGPVLGAVVTALAAGAPITAAVVLNGLLAGLTASGLWSSGKALAESAGAKASAAVADKSAALKALDGP